MCNDGQLCRRHCINSENRKLSPESTYKNANHYKKNTKAFMRINMNKTNILVYARSSTIQAGIYLDN